MSRKSFDIIVIGGGIIGTSVALSIQKSKKSNILLIETEKQLAKHQTGNNSGVIHSGLYYKPGSLKAKNCSDGRKLLYEFCQEHEILHNRCGKIVVATKKSELTALDELYNRGIANGLKGIKKLSAEEIKNYEPNATGLAGLFVPQTGIVDYYKVTNKFAQLFSEKGGTIETNNKFLSIQISSDELVVITTKEEYKPPQFTISFVLYSSFVVITTNSS